jgi:hypothetical protein
LEANNFYNGRTGSSIPKVKVDNLASSGYAASLTSKGNFFQNATNSTGVFFDDGAGSVNIAIYGRTNGLLIPAESLGYNGGVYGAYVPLTPFNALEAVNPYNIYIASETGSNNAIAGSPSYTPIPALVNGDTVIVQLAHTLAGSSSSNTFTYGGTVNGGSAGTAYDISSCRSVLSAITTGYAATGVITLRAVQAFGSTYWCDASQ